MTTTINMQNTIVIVNTCDGNSCVAFACRFLSYIFWLVCPVLVFGGVAMMSGLSPSFLSSLPSSSGFLTGTTMLGSVRRNRKILCFYLVSGMAEVEQAICDVNLFCTVLFLWNIQTFVWIATHMKFCTCVVSCLVSADFFLSWFILTLSSRYFNCSVLHLCHFCSTNFYYQAYNKN
jgi:hypothetical protein